MDIPAIILTAVETEPSTISIDIIGLNNEGATPLLTRIRRGILSVAKLGSDYYAYQEEQKRFIGEESGKIYQIGQRIKVKVEKANPDRREIDFILADE